MSMKFNTTHPVGAHCPRDLLGVEYGDPPYVVRLSRGFDGDGYERGERINGFDECPKCGLWWPCIEEPESWELSEQIAGQWVAVEWCGATVCDDCEVLMVTQPDGTPECYTLS